MAARDRKGERRIWPVLAVLTVLCVYFYVLMEWLFFATKPSFMSILGFFDKLEVLLIAALPLIADAAGLFVLFLIPVLLIRNRRFRRAWPVVYGLIPSIVLALSMFLLVDNFTYTVFKFGVISSQGVWRAAYGLLLLVFIVFSFRFLRDLGTVVAGSRWFRGLAWFAAGLVSVSLVFTLTDLQQSGAGEIAVNSEFSLSKSRPNVLILASDGLNAENMSVYGYHRETTPFIDGLAESALICENCFTNAGCSGASIASMFTGRLPTQTKLIYPPDILKGKDAYLHLPGLLKKHGYRNFDTSIRHYADPYDLNMRKSFDWANSREYKEGFLSEHLGSFLSHEPVYLLEKTYARLAERILHAFFARKMDDVYKEVVRSKKHRRSGRINDFYSFIDVSRAPFLAHLHLLGTHGPMFHPEKRVFSAAKYEGKPWMTDFYDDAILNFDIRVDEIFQSLKLRGLLDNTLIIITTDHGQGFSVNDRIPLIFIFPGGKHSGRIKGNVQLLDVAATITGFLGLEQPEWMGGRSLISSPPDSSRLIFTVDRIHGETYKIRMKRGLGLNMKKLTPPFWTLGSVGVFYRDKLFMLDLRGRVLRISDVEGHTCPCDERDMPDPYEIGRAIVEHLEETGYDVSSLETPEDWKLDYRTTVREGP